MIRFSKIVLRLFTLGNEGPIPEFMDGGDALNQILKVLGLNLRP